MYNRIAVIYRGHLRTWNYVKDNNFSFFESISKNVDYYFVTWNLPYNLKSLKKDFNNKDLIKVLSVDIVSGYYNLLSGPAWLSYNIIPYKKEREKDVTYDAVFDLRPDIFVLRIQDKPLLPLRDKTLYIPWEERISGWDKDANVIHDIGIEDLYGVMKSNTYDIVSHRFSYKGALDAHMNYKKFCDYKKILVSIDMYSVPLIIRPNMIDIISTDMLLSDPNISHICKLRWEGIPKETKRRILKRHKIIFEDYFVS